MKGKKNIIIGNWKMNGSLSSIKTLCEGINKHFIGYDYSHDATDIVVCVPYVYLSYVRNILNKKIKLGVQNISEYNNGAYTGEISSMMLTDFNCKYVIIGHSERRRLFKENDKVIFNKIKQTLKSDGLSAILCIGESLSQRNMGIETVKEVLEKQLYYILKHLLINKTSLEKIIIAYEPVWAIGTNLAATNNQIQEIHEYLRNLFIKKINHTENINIVYGGSLNSSNAQDILSLKDVDGGLVGGSSINYKEFNKIIQYSTQI